MNPGLFGKFNFRNDALYIQFNVKTHNSSTLDYHEFRTEQLCVLKHYQKQYGNIKMTNTKINAVRI